MLTESAFTGDHVDRVRRHGAFEKATRDLSQSGLPIAWLPMAYALCRLDRASEA
jgi:hypothetical protein